MSWNLLLTLFCPVLMLFGMGKMFFSKKRQDPSPTAIPSQDTPHDVHELQLQIADLMVENHQLKVKTTEHLND
ncbi:hypothetical protein [Ferroacidibacillus organovorans]|uniref:DUF2933 domain-containing protein n=1 Tax=Ferroacidibacillus organovorans TaxID=1765683 RepID=A0A124IWF5_9BACL|nr:hypothetical protein [Ferroacidibacillus organovorans]KUO97234.1 hypothetical protein ATW55_11605 [Ferroacidibacillus organovorans]